MLSYEKELTLRSEKVLNYVCEWLKQVPDNVVQVKVCRDEYRHAILLQPHNSKSSSVEIIIELEDGISLGAIPKRGAECKGRKSTKSMRD